VDDEIEDDIDIEDDDEEGNFEYEDEEYIDVED
jgi:hypothetical protein